MCCVWLEWSVLLHPSWLRSRKNGRKRERERLVVVKAGGQNAL